MGIQHDNLPASSILGGDGYGPRIELEPGTEAEPFAALGHDGRFSRTLLARVYLGREPLGRLALKIQRDESRGHPDHCVTNVDIDSMWAAEQAAHAALDSEQSPFRNLGGPASPSRPITFCRKTKVYFAPPCPLTGGDLHVCRDDERLRRLGLPTYSESAIRVLLSPAESATVYCSSQSDLSDVPGVTVRRGSELYRDLGALARGEIDNPSDAFPCSNCTHRAECFPKTSGDAAIPAEHHLVSVAYYDAFVLAMKLLELRFGELCDLLAGAPWSEVRARIVSLGAPGRRMVAASVESSRLRLQQWTCQNNGNGLFAVEVLSLELQVFQQLLSRVVRVWQHTESAHGKLSTDHVLAGLDDLPQRDSPPSERLPFDVWPIDLGAVRAPHDRDARFEPKLDSAGIAESDPGSYQRDLFALGRLWFRALLIHDEQDAPSVDAAVDAITESMTVGEVQPGAGLARALAENAPLFDRVALLYRSSDRLAGAAALSQRVWIDALSAGFELTTASAIENRGDAETLIDRIRMQLEGVEQHLRVELDGRQERSGEVVQVCDEVITRIVQMKVARHRSLSKIRNPNR